MTENELYANKLRIYKYEVAVDRAKKIQSEIEVIKSIIKSMEEGSCRFENLCFYGNTVANGDLTKQYENNYSKTLDNYNDGVLLTISALDLNFARGFIDSYVTDAENKEFFHFDIRIAIFKTIEEELYKVQNNIKRYMEWILNCDDSELKHQIKQKAIGESVDNPDLFEKGFENPIDMTCREIMTNKGYIQFALKNRMYKDLLTYISSFDKTFEQCINDDKWMKSEYNCKGVD